MWNYSEKVKEHFLNPKNVGEIEDPETEAQVGSLACGDALKIMLRIDEDGKIVDAKFKTFGCGSAIASSSALTEIIKGMSVEEASKVTNQDIAEYLDGLPEEKMHCSVMGREALEKALKKFQGKEVEEEIKLEGELVCKCFGVTDTKIKKTVKENDLKTIDEVTHYTKAGGGCQLCHPKIEELIEKARGEMKDKKGKPASEKMTNIEKIELIRETLEREIRPILKKDGGDIELIDLEDNEVSVALRGQCTNCLSSDVTIKSFVQEKLREHVAENLDVREVDQ